MTTDLAKLVEVERHGAEARVLVDGEPFPWAIADTNVVVEVSRGNVPGVTVTILAREVRVADSLDARKEPPS